MRTLLLVLGLVLLGIINPLDTFAQERPDSTGGKQQSGVRCEQMVFCAGVKDRAPVGVSDAFPSDIYRVYCYTTVVGADDTTAIVHNWYHGDARVVAVELSVKAARWRTWSSKRMAPGWQGLWRVEVTTADGVLIESREFSLE